MKQGSILVVDDNKAILSALNLLLPIYFKNVRLLSSPNAIVSELARGSYDVVLLDMNFSAGINSGNEGFYWLTQVKAHSPMSEVVMFTAYADIDLAVRAMKEGAFDFVVKPWDNAKLVATLTAAMEMATSRRELKRLKEIKTEFRPEGGMLWGVSGTMEKLKSLVEKVASTDAFVLITGENGTGKDMMAREIHRLSARSGQSMVTVDVASLPASLFESELFGHVKGAFTDAKGDRAGKFEVADGGTLFLDEIGNIPLELQAKLLSAIQGRSVVRVGSNKVIPVDIRLICATNKNLDDMVASGEFREDLLYRINTIHITLPPLRERAEDIVPLANIFLKRYAAKYGKDITSISPRAEDKLRAYQWKGNIRELQHAVEKAVILSDGHHLKEGDFLLSGPSSRSGTGRAHVGQDVTLEDMEKDMIRSAMSRHGGNLTLVAQQLGITRQTLYNKLKKYGL